MIFRPSESKAWKDGCIVANLSGDSVPVPYSLARRLSSYEKGMNSSAAIANSIIRNIIRNG